MSEPLRQTIYCRECYRHTPHLLWPDMRRCLRCGQIAWRGVLTRGAAG